MSIISTGSDYDSHASVHTHSPPADREPPPPKDPASTLFDEAAAVRTNLRYDFTTSGNLRQKLGQVHERYKDDTTVHLLVTGVNEEAVDAAMRSLPFRPFIRVWFESDAHAARIRMIMPSAEHEIACQAVASEITEHVRQIPGHNYRSLTAVGATRFSCPGRRSKEGDAGLRCSTRAGGAAWPNLMIEVGYSEPLPQLHMDARWWLEASNGQTRMVIIISVSKNPNTHLEAWTMQPNPNSLTRQSPANVPAMNDVFDIDAAGTLIPPSAALTIP